MSVNNKFELGYEDYRYGSILSYENEVLQSVFINKASDLEDTPVNDRFADGMHAVPLPMTRNYIPSGPNVEIDYSKFTYGPKQTSADESDSKPTEYASCESDSSVETSTSMPEPVENASKGVCVPKVWTDAPIIEEYESDSDNDLVSNVQEDKEKPSFAFTYSVKHVKTSSENIKETGTTNHSPKIEKHDRNGHTRKGLGYDFTRKACFDDPHRALKDKGIIDNGCFRHMTGKKAHLADYQEFMGSSVAFRGSNRRITGKEKIKTGSAGTQAKDDQGDKIETNTGFKTCEKPFTMSNTHQELASPESNSFCKELASPKQMALGKDISNPLMASRLPKTTLPTRLLKVNAASPELTTARVSAVETSLTIRTSCIKQFWTTAKVKTINDEVRIQALIDEKRVNIKESSILCTLKLDDAEVKNIEAVVPFFMFPRFVQLLIDHQLGDMSHHKDIYDNPSLKKKVFANMKRVGTGFSGVVTPLFDNMLVPAAKEVGLIQDDVQSLSIPTEPSTFKPHKNHKPKKQQTQAPKVPSPEPLPECRLPSPFNVPLPSGKDSLKLKELMELCTHLSNKVLELESKIIDIKSTYKERIEKLEGRVDRLEKENKVLKELHSVHSKVDTAAPIVKKEKSFKQGRIIANIDEDDVDDEEPTEVEEVLKVVTAAKLITEVVTTAGATTIAKATKIEQYEAFARQLEAELNADINWNVVIEQVKRSKRLNDAVIKYQALKRKPLTEAKARKNMIIYLKNMAGYKMNYFKGMTYSEIRPLFEKRYNYNQAFLEEVNEDVTVPEKKVEVKEATPLASKSPIVDYKIHLKRNKPYFKIIRADEPKNYTNDYLLKTLKTMFEQPNVEASVWRDQKGRYGLAKRYSLTHFTLEQMLNNVRLEVEEESEMSLELLRLIRRQLNEGGGLLGIMDFNILLLFFILSSAAWNYCNLFPPLDNPELTIRRRSRSDPTLLNNSEMAAEGPGDLPVLDLRTMEELCQPSLNGRGDDANKHLDKFLHVTQSIKVNGVTDDALRLYLFPHSLTHHATAWFDRLPRNLINTFEQMAKMFLGKYFPPSMVTKLRNEITNFRQRPDESLFEAWERYKLSIDRCPNHNMLPVTQIDMLYNGLTLRHHDTINAAAGGTFMKRRPEECYDLIENIAHHNDWDTSAQRNKSSSSITSSSDTEIVAVKAEMAEINKNLMRVLQVNQHVKAVTPNCETCGGPHSFSDCSATVGQTQNVYAAGAYQDNSYQPQGNRNLLSYHSDNYLGPPGNNQGRNQFFQGANQGQNQPSAYQAPAYQAPIYQAMIHQPQIPQHQVVTTNEFTNFMKANDAILKNMQTNMTSLTNSNLELKSMFGQFMKMNTASSSGSGTLLGNTITNPKEDLKGITTRRGTAYPGPTIPTTSSFSPVVERETEATKDTVHPTNNGSTEDVQPPVVPTESPILNSEPVNSPIIEPVVSPDLNFNISFVDALILIPKFGPSIKSLLTNKDKLCELARTPLNEHCLAILLKKFLEKLGDPDKFMIPCDFPGMAECLALADLGASINLMPLSVWNKLSVPDLSPTCMTLELVDHSISRPVRVAEDVYVKVGTFHFPADFVVVDFDADPRVPLILERSFLKTGKALIDVFEGELTLRVSKEAITFNLDQTSRYSANYNDMTANHIDMACEEYLQEVLGFSDVIASGNPTPYYDPIVSTTSSTLTLFENSDFLLEEVDAFLAIEDDPTSPEVYQSYVDTDRDILLLKAFLNDDPSLPPPNQGNYLPEVRKELKICEAKSNKSSIDETLEVELQDLPPHLEYVFLEGDDKLPVITAKDLSVE
uniref:Retrotransposon gag domain-containing protein n=1 Tax=Tanacetum cinerariifolium TaxID=118510 RepID=A0A6L2MHU4_TANCI|nr:hypothetical protein [Tanacetum cinerariifolium]